MDEELDRVKRFDLRQYAATLGFVIDKRESSRGSTVMRRDHEKIIISRKPDGHYTYWNPHDDLDHGTIIDLVQRHKGLTLGGVRKELRAWTGSPSPAVLQLPELVAATTDFDVVRKRFAAMRLADRHPYLEHERGIPEALLSHWRFAGTIRIDHHGAAIFPHTDADGNVCGYEIKNSGGFTGFAAGGRKQIWLSNAGAVDKRLVICESAIDALSHAVLFEDAHARYGSIAGKMTAAQHAVIQAAILAMPPDAEIIAATDADEAGRDIAFVIENLVRDCGRDEVKYRRHEPEEGSDFNDVLRRIRKASLAPTRRGTEPVIG